ncbi:MAG: MCP four helix bundle domain-containing protein [Bacteroidetes bacterium]|jgi:two-component system, NtrC family, sensor histidine kinase HydH|nr:MCP four helix bundle domain-containing protein [Bacteroidota bacterium]
MRIPKLSFHLSYQMIVWALVSIALLLAVGYLIISYIYQLQDNTKVLITENAISTRNAQDLRLALYRVRAASLTNVFDKSDEQIQNLEREQKAFLLLVDKADQATNTFEENKLIQQISALFSNYEQTLKNAIEMHRKGRLTQPNAVILLASQDLINTIEDKTNQLINIKEEKQNTLENSIEVNDNIITTAIYSLGISGIIMGLILGWLIARIILNPIYKLVLKVRDAAGSEVVEHIRMTPGKELEELDLHINRLIGRINKANEDLQKNRELLDRSAKFAAVGKIAPALAHEIRNPLTSIKMLIHSMLQESEDGSEQKGDLEIMLHEINRMEEFLQNFLKYARPSKPQMQQIDAIEVIRQVLHLMQARLKQSNISLKENYEETAVIIKADPNMLKQILMNLIINAVDAMGKSGVLTISTRKTTDTEGQPTFIISVEDTGSGIPAEIIDTLFDPFVKNKEHGIGLGLSISQRIADLHHGHIHASNNHPNGAVFSLHLPIQS